MVAWLFGAVLVAGTLAGEPVAAAPEADLIIVGAPVHTMDARGSEARAIAVADGRIVVVGERRDAMARRGRATRVIELDEGDCVLPGLIDAHGHIHSLGESLQNVRLAGTTSKEECAARVRARQENTPRGRWIQGRGWDQNDWEVMEFPTWRDLAGTEANPVYIKRVGGHAAWLNRAALDIAGITRDTPDPDGGRIVRDADGEPTGIVIDNAKDLVTAHIPDPSPAEIDEHMLGAVEHCTSLGLVAMHDAGTTEEELASLERLAKGGRLKMRVYCMLSDEDEAWLLSRLRLGVTSVADGRVVARAVKLYADGALGSRGAALLAPYADAPDNTGLLVTRAEKLLEMTMRALEAGFQVCTHAIGDRGNSVTLDAYEKAQAVTGGPGDERLRVEHAQVVAERDFARYARLKVIASMQPTHATSDMYWAEERLGPERVRGAYAWRRFLDDGNPLPFGSDFPVESADPLWGIYAAVTRSDHEGWPEGGWHPDQRLTVTEALRGFTASAAYAEFAEDERGSIEVGKRADLVVLDRDLLRIDPREILETKVRYTVVDGEIVYASDQSQ